ncbi:MAG: AraC family transcriptional regulator [Phycisphaeraceae bacterium]
MPSRIPEGQTRWPLRATPKIAIAGQFALTDRDFAHRYRSPTHALHLHEYAGWIRFEGAAPHRLTPGTLTLSPAGRSTAYALDAPGRHWCIHFKPARAQGASVGLPWLVPPGPGRAYQAERFARVAALLVQSKRDRQQPTLLRHAAAAALQELLLSLPLASTAGPTASRTTEADAAIERLLAWIDQHMDEPVTVPALARQAGLSQNYLARRFRERFGLTIQRHLLERRIEQAQLLLATTDLPVKAIAARVGIPDPHYFNKQFRRLTGSSPLRARQISRWAFHDRA